MTLLLDNSDIEQVLSMTDCIDALEVAFRDLAEGKAVNRPRSHTYTDLGNGRHYLFKSMDGSVPRLGVHAIRMSSDQIQEVERDARRRREKIPAAPGGRYVGLVMLFDIATLAPLAILQDGYLQRMRVGATSALAARYLAREDSETVGLIGSGWQAGAQLLGLHERGTIKSYRVFSPNANRLAAFCDEFRKRLGSEVRPVASAREAVDGADIIALATNSHDPVIDGSYLAPGQHIGSVQGHELDRTTLDRADIIAVRSKEPATFHFAPGHAPREAAERKRPEGRLVAKFTELGDIVARGSGRRSDREITLFAGGATGASSGLGIQFAAVADAVYRAARRAGLGRELDTGWFTEAEKP